MALSVDHIQLPTELMKHVGLIASLDRGCSLLKVLFATQSDYEASKSQDHITLTLELFHTKDFLPAIDSLLKQVHTPDDPSKAVLKVTGAGADREMQILKEKSPYKVVFVDEFFSQASGNYYLIKHVPHSEICYPEDEFLENHYSDSTGFIKNISEKLLADGIIPKQETTFPCIVGFLGSAGVFLLIDENGKTDIIGGHGMSGKCFLGLGRLLLNTKDYDEIMELAEKGDRRNIDTQIFEVFQNTEDSPYGKYKPDMPVFTFGKAVDYDKNVEDFNREDVAASFVYAYAGQVSAMCAAFGAMKKCSRVFLGGNLCRSGIMRKGMDYHRRMLSMNKMLTVQHLKTGHSAAVGALLADPDKENLIW